MFTVNVKPGEEIEKSLNYAKYKLTGTRSKEELTFYVGCRANAYPVSEDFYKSIDGWISVTNNVCFFHKPTDFMWFPWNEENHCLPETFFGVIMTLLYWEMAGKRRFYIFCDAGTHRAPTVFGAYLWALFDLRTRHDVVAKHELIGREHLSDPLEYIGFHLEDVPEDGRFLKQCRHGPLNSLESIVRQTQNTFDRRYGCDRPHFK